MPISTPNSGAELVVDVGVDAETDVNVDEEAQDEERISWGPRLD